MPIISSIISQLRAELDLLEQKTAAVKAILELYGDDAAPPVPTAMRTEEPGATHGAIADAEPPVANKPEADGPASVPLAVHRSRFSVRKPNESTTAIRRIARDLIIANDRRPVPTRQVIATAKQQGVEIRGLKEASAVAAILTRSPDFANVEKAGWVLTDHGSA